ncbi:MAG: putative glucan 1,3-beta-glucosidase [Pseudomonadota bacterium]
MSPRLDARPWIGAAAFCFLLLLVLCAWLGQLFRPQSLPASAMQPGQKVQCVSYSPYHRPGQSPLDPNFVSTREEIAADLEKIARISECVRLYSVSQGLEEVPALARQYGLKVLLGAWISADRAHNRVELARAVELAKANTDVVTGLIIGNEVLLRREMGDAELESLIRQTKAQIPVPVTYADVWEFWLKSPQLADAVDFVTIHILPFWEDQPVPISHAADHVLQVYQRMAQTFTKPLLIGETGWPSAGRQREQSAPSRVNEALFLRQFINLAVTHGWKYNLIEAIDQPWKRNQEGTVGGYWGMLEAESLAEKFPLTGGSGDELSERQGLPLLLVALLLGLVGLPVLGYQPGNPWRLLTLALLGALGGGIAGLQWQHMHEAYRTQREWLLLGGLSGLAGLLLVLLVRLPTAGRLTSARNAWQQWRHGQRDASTLFALLRGVFLFAAAVAALLLYFDPRYRDFPSLLYLVPALCFLLARAPFTAGHSGPRGREEILCGLVILLTGLGRWWQEPGNIEAIVWLLLCLTLAALALWPGRQRAE